MYTDTSKILAAILVGSFALSLTGCSSAPDAEQIARSTVQTSAEAQRLREEVISVYMRELSDSDDPVQAERAILQYYSAQERTRREESLEKYGDRISDDGFAENHPGFDLDTVEWTPQDATTVLLSWVAERECGGVDEHGTAFLVDVAETVEGSHEVTRFSHSTGCACASCTEA